MGRYVRPILVNLAARENIALTLLVREPRAGAAYESIVGDDVEVAPLAAARSRGAYDRIWYPWNGVRFAARAPAVVTINDDFAFAFAARGFIARRREQAPIRRAVRDAARIVTISAWSRAALMARFGLAGERISVIPLSPAGYFSPGPERSPFPVPFVLAIGAGEARKNIAFLIDAFARAFPAGDVRLVVVGDPEPGTQRRLRAATVPVTVLPRIDDEYLRRLYRTAAVVAVPSLAEGFGLVAAEAQACGAAVLAANTSALPETIGDAGRLVDPRDADAWCEALRALVRDPAASARYRALAAARWTSSSAQRTTDALLAALERTVDDGA